MDIHIETHMSINKMKVDTHLTPSTKINLKQIIYLNVKWKSKNILEDNIWETTGDLGFGNKFFNKTHTQKSPKEKKC